MPRNPSLSVREAIYSQETDTAFLLLLKLTHPNLDTDITVTSDAVETVHNNTTYDPFPFRVRLPSETKDEISNIEVQIDNVSREVVSAIRQIDSEPEVELKVVASSDPDTVEAGPYNFVFKDISYDAQAVTGQLKNPALDEATFPADTMNPSSFPGLFKNV